MECDERNYKQRQSGITVKWLAFCCIICLLPALQVQANDITEQVFGSIKEGIVAAFGDLNSDELTDVFLIRNDRKTLQVLKGAMTEPLLRVDNFCQYDQHYITSVVPGDFDGDALMDVMVTLQPTNPSGPSDIHHVYINWGAANGEINCSKDATEQPLIITKGEPLAIDYDRNMVIDLYGQNNQGARKFWVFHGRGQIEEISQVPLVSNVTHDQQVMSIPNANAYLDLNDDFTADLFVQTHKNFEVWYGRTGDNNRDFDFKHFINVSIDGLQSYILGQAVFADIELLGSEYLILPVCIRDNCENSTLLVHNCKPDGSFRGVHVDFHDPQGVQWGFVPPDPKDAYLKTITARSGDYNMDGYPDLLMTLQTLTSPQRLQTFLLENVPCIGCNKQLKRTFSVRWNAFAPVGNSIVAGAFYDFYQDGILDVIFIERTGPGQYRPHAFRNTLDYDANFVKVIVLTGLVNKKNATQLTTLGLKRRTYGTNLPGPRITYSTITQEGDIQRGSSVQLPQSAYFALQLPYTIFGLGRTPNFVDSLTVGLRNKWRVWTQLIPNSQIIVVPTDDPANWKMQLFVTPSKLILMSVFALGGTCLVIVFIILLLYIKEKREDKQEKLQEAHRFHFDAM